MPPSFEKAMPATRQERPAPLRARFYGLKAAVARVLCHPAMGRVIASVYHDRIPNRGCFIHTADPVVAPRIKASIYWGIYEGAEVRFVRRHLRADLDVVELGSSLGVVSAHIAQKLSPNRRLICVEANPHLLELISKNVRGNSSQAQLDVVHGAIDHSAQTTGSVRFALGADNTVSHLAGPQPARNDITVPALTLGGILVEHQLSTHALVCDIEGAEAGLIENEVLALRSCRQLIIELHETDRDGRHFTVEELRDRLVRDHGFRQRDQYGPAFVFDRPDAA